jgi:membrane glycosyltransferase
MTPVILGLLLAIPMGAFSSSSGTALASSLFRTPEDIAPPPVITRANELASGAEAPIACPFLELRRNEILRHAHLSNQSGQRPRGRGEVDTNLAIARAKIEDAESFEEAVGYLTQREKLAVLKSPAILMPLLQLPQRNS